MERNIPCDLSDAAVRDTNDTKDYPDQLLDRPDSPLILGSQAVAACSTEYVELVPTAPPAARSANAQQGGSPDRALDVMIAGLLLLFVLPLMLLCALAVLLNGSGPVIFRQLRIGRGGREFTCFKFRTMIPSAEPALESILVDGSPFQEEWAAIYKLREDPRLTFVGRFMRRYSLDELPQLFNVLKGDMSVVGPRPIVAAEIYRYGDRYADYCSVNPGITGLWQVSGRHALSYDERVRLDSEYARHKSVRLDLLILWKTVPVVLSGQNE
jgi:exopolysaccharide production protein ExoY